MHSIFASIADAKLWSGANIPPNQEALIPINGQFQRWRFALGSAAVDTSEQLVFAPTTSPASGKWTRADPVVDLKLPWAFNTANNTVLLTVPTGLRLNVLRVVPETVVPLTGLDTGSIGLGSTITLNAGGLATITGLLGGFQGFPGVDIASPQSTTLVAGDAFRHNLLVAGYTAGSGFWHALCALLQT